MTRDSPIGDRLILGFFSPGQKDSIDTLYRLYVDHRIRKVQFTPSFYFGWEVFDHFFWHSENPQGFFEIEKKRFIIFQIWNSRLSELSATRIFSTREAFRTSTPEVKVVNPTLRPYFVLPDQPLHRGFEYLSLTHKSDYLRCYLCHFHGGGYSDTKHFHTDWQPSFEKLAKSPSDKYAMGYFEVTFPYPICHEEPG